MIGWAWLSWAGCADRGEPSKAERSAYAGCTERAVVETQRLGPDAPDIPNQLLTVVFDPLGWKVESVATYDEARPPLDRQTWERRPDGQVTEWVNERDGWLEARTTTAYDDDGVAVAIEEDRDGDGRLDATTDLVNEGGLTREEWVDDGADGEVDWVYLWTWDDWDRLVARSGRFSTPDGAEFHQERWVQGPFGWVIHEATVFLYTELRSTRTFDGGGRLVADHSEDLDQRFDETYTFLDRDDLFDGGTTSSVYQGQPSSSVWTVERDAAGRILRWTGESDDDDDGVLDSVMVQASTWDCPG